MGQARRAPSITRGKSRAIYWRFGDYWAPSTRRAHPSMKTSVRANLASTSSPLVLMELPYRLHLRVVCP